MTVRLLAFLVTKCFTLLGKKKDKQFLRIFSKNGGNYNFQEQRKLTGWIPVFGKYKPQIEGFPYNKEKDEYSPMDRPLPFKGFSTNKYGNRTEKLLGGTEGLQGLPHETPICTKKEMQKYHQNDIRRTWWVDTLDGQLPFAAEQVRYHYRKLERF